MGRSMHGQNGNQMEECHEESETSMDYDIHEPHDQMETIMLDSKKWNDIWRETITVYLGEETTTRSGESVLVCPKRGVTGTN